MEELRARTTDWGQNIQNMSVDFRMPDDPFKRRRRKHRHGPRSRGHGAGHVSGTRAPREGDRVMGNGQLNSQSETGSSSYSYSSNDSESGSGSETGSEATQSERVVEGKEKDVDKENAFPESLYSQPLDYFGENLAYIDESSDAVSGKLHLDPLLDPAQPVSARSRKPKRRRPRRPPPEKIPKISPTKPEKKEPNGDIPPENPPPPPPKDG